MSSHLKDKDNESPQLLELAETLVKEFADQVPQSTVRELVQEAAEEFREARVKSYVPVLVQRHVRLALQRRTRTGNVSLRKHGLISG